MAKIEFRAFIPPILSGIRTGGETMRVTFDIPSSDIKDAVALIALRDTPLRITVEVDDSKTATQPAPDPFDGVAEAYPDDDGPARPLPLPEKEPPTKGPWSAFWRECYAHGIQNVPALHKELGCNGMGDSVKLKLRERFKEDSLTKVSPDRFQAWCATKRLQEVLALTEQALSKIGGIEYKWGKKAQKEDAA